MGLDPDHFRRYVVQPTLAQLQGYLPDTPIASPAAEELLLMTAAHESGGLVYLDQITGPDDRRLGWAYGLYQIEAATHADVWRTFLADDRYRALRHAVETLRAPAPGADLQLVTNLAYATAIARCIYYRDPHALPAADDVAGLAHYAKRVFNTEDGKATPAAYANAYRRLRTREGLHGSTQ